MILDFSGNGSSFDEVIVIPDWNFLDMPVGTEGAGVGDRIGGHIYIGADSNTSINIGGEIDDPDS